VKFLCNTEFIHSGERAYFSGTVYSDITTSGAERLIALDKKKSLGALSFFTPVDEEAAGFIKAVKNNGVTVKKPGPPSHPDAGEGNLPKVLTRSELIAEAKNLGIKGADRMSVDELKEVTASVKTGRQTAEPDVIPDTGKSGVKGS
jgi:hypothetical protein